MPKLVEGQWPRIKAVLSRSLLLLIFARFILRGLVRVTWNIASDAIDQGVYLQLGLFMREGRAFTDGNRNPLYPAILALFARREWAYFTEAKLLSLLFGLAGLLLVFYLSRKLFGASAALASILLLSTNDHYQMYTSWVAGESLLLIFFFVTWYLVATGFQDRRRWLGAGVTAGLAALTKGTGQFLIFAFLATALLTLGKRLFQQKWVYVVVVAYFVVISPMLMINTFYFGNPLYNYNTTHAVWFDNWEDAYIVGRRPATMLSYLKTHSMPTMIAREVFGLYRVADVWSFTLFPDYFNLFLGPIRSKGRIAAFAAFSIISLLLLLITWRKGARSTHRTEAFRGGTVFTLILCFLVYLSFSWYAQVMYKARFMMPLNPIIYTGLLGLVSIFLDLPAFASVRKRPLVLALGRMAYAGVALAMISYLAYSLVTTVPQLRDPYRVDLEANLPREDVLKWLVARAEPGEPVLWGPSHYLPRWKYTPRLEFVPIPVDLVSWQELEAYVHQQGIRYWILDFSTIGRREELLRPYFDRHYEQIVFKQLSPRWDLVHADRKFIFDYCLFRVYPKGQELPPMKSLSQVGVHRVGIGPQIELLGYHASLENTPSGKGVDLVLYWRARERVAENYKVFTHLLNPEGTLHSQHDEQPLYGFWPTGAWEPGQTVVDHHYLPIGDDASPGAYRIEVGLYDGEMMERLPIMDLGTGLVLDDHLILPATVYVAE